MRVRILGVLMTIAMVALQTSGDKPECQGLYYRASRIQSNDLGFCWYFFNGNFTMSEAEALCKHHGGHLPAVNSFSKADKLARFAGAMRDLYVNGSFDRSWLPVYAGGWKGATLWAGHVSKLGNGSDDVTRVWSTSNVTVSYQGYANDSSALPDDDSCAVLDMLTATWRFTTCQGVNTVICEESGHEYDNDSPDEDANATWTGVEHHESPDNTNDTYSGGEIHNFNATTCPTGYQLSRGRCLRLGHVSGIFAADLFCKHRSGFLAVVTNANDEKELGAYIAEHKTRKWGSFLSPMQYNGDHFVWTSTGQHAEYVSDKFNLVPTQSLVFDTLLVFTPAGRLTTCDRHKCNARAFCQANGDDYYAYTNEEEETEESDDFETDDD